MESPSRRAADAARLIIRESLESLRHADASGLRSTLDETLSSMSSQRFVSQIVLPLLDELASLWDSNELPITSCELAVPELRLSTRSPFLIPDQTGEAIVRIITANKVLCILYSSSYSV